MAGLNLPYPKFIDHAVPGNRQCGVCPTDLPEQLQAYCARMTESVQGCDRAQRIGWSKAATPCGNVERPPPIFSDQFFLRLSFRQPGARKLATA